MTALRTQYVNLTSHADNADGTLTVTAIARRSGIMKYRSDSGDRFEFVPPDLIDARDDQGRPIMGMLAGAPNTLEHPSQVIRYSADSRKAVQVGKVSEEIHIYTDADGERSVKVRFDVSDPETIADIKSGRKTGVSLGYLCNVIKEDGDYKGTTYTHRQAMPFTIDHLAIVANPRNPGALITRFDSEDIAVMAAEDARSSFEVIRVDACCAACDGQGKPGCSDDIEEDEPKAKKKKVKTDAEDLVTIPIVFREGSHNVGVDVANALWAGGVVDRVRMDGGEYFISADIAHGLAIEGVIHRDMGEACGRGWFGSQKGKCVRKKAAGGFSGWMNGRQQSNNKKFKDKVSKEIDRINLEATKKGKPIGPVEAKKIAKQNVFKKQNRKGLIVAGGAILAAAAIKSAVTDSSRTTRQERKTGTTNRSPRAGYRTVKLDSRTCGKGWRGTEGNCIRSKGTEAESAAHAIKSGASVGTSHVKSRIKKRLQSVTSRSRNLLPSRMDAGCGKGWEGTAGNCRRSVPNAIGHGIASAGRSIGRGIRIGGGKVVRFAKSETGQRMAATAVQLGTIAAVNHFKNKEVSRRKAYSDWQKNGGPRPGYKTIYEDDK